MIKQKLYTRLNQRDKVALLPKLSGTQQKEEHRSVRARNRVTRKSRGRVVIEADLCKGCLLCIEACAPNVLVVSESLNRMGYHPVKYLGEGCTGCGVCFYVCPEPGSIRVYKKLASNKERTIRGNRVN